MKSKLALVMVGGAFVVMFVDVNLVRAELWINPLFEFAPIAANMSLVKLSDGSVVPEPAAIGALGVLVMLLLRKRHQCGP